MQDFFHQQKIAAWHTTSPGGPNDKGRYTVEVMVADDESLDVVFGVETKIIQLSEREKDDGWTFGWSGDRLGLYIHITVSIYTYLYFDSLHIVGTGYRLSKYYNRTKYDIHMTVDMWYMTYDNMWQEFATTGSRNGHEQPEAWFLKNMVPPLNLTASPVHKGCVVKCRPWVSKQKLGLETSDSWQCRKSWWSVWYG